MAGTLTCVRSCLQGDNVKEGGIGAAMGEEAKSFAMGSRCSSLTCPGTVKEASFPLR